MAASDSEDELLPTASSTKRTNFQRLVSSSSEEEREEIRQKQKKTRNRIRSRQVTSSGEEDDSNNSLQKPCCSSKVQEVTPKKKRIFIEDSSEDSDLDDIPIKSVKEQRKMKLEMMALKKNPKYQQYLNDCETESDDDNENDSSEKFEEKTRVFTAKYSNPCDLPACKQRHIRNVTKILGVRIFDETLGTYIGKRLQDGRESHFWVCASHSQFWKDFSDHDNDNEYVSDSNFDDEDFDDASNGFIDDSNPSENPESEMSDSNDFQEILNGLARSTEKDKENKEKYIEEHSKYQLQVHSETNPGLHLNPGKRFKRNMDIARFDKGLKNDRGIDSKDPEYQDAEDIFVFGRLVRIFPKTKRISFYSQNCGLAQCDEKFTEHQTEIIGAMIKSGGRLILNSRQKPFNICYNHVREFKNIIRKKLFEDDDHSSDS